MYKNGYEETDEGNDELCRNTTQQRIGHDFNAKKKFSESKENQKSNPFERRKDCWI